MGDDEEGRAFPIVGDGNSGKKKKVEPDGWGKPFGLSGMPVGPPI